MKVRHAAAVAAVPLTAVALTAALAGPVAAQTRGAVLTATLTGAAEVPGPGDPDGSGTAFISVNPGTELLCYELTAEDIDTTTGAHIHVAPVDAAGPVVVPLIAPGVDGVSSDCMHVDRELAIALISHPEDYYVNIHTVPFPAGAIRGQLEHGR
jgi:hypothetical protein